MPLIGQRFFKLFHTKFDFENKILKFYNEDTDKIRFSYDRHNDDSARIFGNDVHYGLLDEDTMKIIVAVIIVLAILIVFCCIYRCCRRNGKSFINNSEPKVKNSKEMI